MNSVANNQAQAPLQTLSTPVNPGANIEMTKQKDAKESAGAPKFGELLNKMQAQYGARAEKPREIKKTLGKDDFLRIMITQMRNQDPTNPFKAEQMATEMAQFTSVEQLHNLNSNFQKMAGQNQPMERMLMTQMIGKNITVDKDRFPHTEGQKESLSVVVPKNASQVNVEIVNDAGETVAKMELGPQRAGVVPFMWDGNKLNSMPAKAGGYQVKVDASDERGSKMEINNQARARIAGVAFEGQEPVFLIGEGARQERITLKNIVRVETDSATGAPAAAPRQPQMNFQSPPASQAPAAHAPTTSVDMFGSAPAVNSAPQAPEAAASSGIQPLENPSSTKNFFTFEKGVGAQPLDPALLPPHIQKVLAAAAEKGFPSGLSDPEQQKQVESEKGGSTE